MGECSYQCSDASGIGPRCAAAVSQFLGSAMRSLARLGAPLGIPLVVLISTATLRLLQTRASLTSQEPHVDKVQGRKLKNFETRSFCKCGLIHRPYVAKVVADLRIVLGTRGEVCVLRA